MSAVKKTEAAKGQKPAPKKEVKKTSSVAQKMDKKAKGGKDTDPGYEIVHGIPDSQYFTFKDENWNSLISAIFGTPGIMRGKIIEIAGKSDVGKSALARSFTAMAQAQGEVGFDIDAEKSLTKEFAAKLGLDTKKLLLVRPDHGEGAMLGLRKVVQMGGKFGVLDSSTACLPKAETNDEGGGMGAQARMMSSEMKKVDKIIDKYGANLIIISQIKTKPGVTFGNPDYVSSGGSAVGFHSRIRMIISKVEVEKDEATKQEMGFTVRVVVTKNHTGPKRTSPFDLSVDHMFRIDLTKTAVKWAKQWKLVDRDKKTICGVAYDRAGHDADLEKAIKGKESAVFAEVDAIFQERESGKVPTFEEQADSTGEVVGEDMEGMNVVDVSDDEDDGEI